jgi:hypothetical protein
MKRLLFILIGLCVIVVLVIYLTQLTEPRSRDYETETVWESRPTAITMLCSDDKEDWIRKAASDFGRRRPDINIKVHVMSSVDGLNAILSRRTTATLWSPTETEVLHHALYRWRKEFGVSLFELDGEDAPRSLARSPLVWLSWKSRIDAITAAIETHKLKPEAVWAEIGCAGVPGEPSGDWPAKPARWDELPAFKPDVRQPGVNRLSTWGEIKFYHTDPTRSNAGFDAIYLMAYQFLGQPDPLTPSLLKGDPFLTWFQRCQRLRKTFPDSVNTLTNRLFQFGPDNYDIVVTYENVALQNMLTATNRWSEQPYLYYPRTTAWADHPIVILNSSDLPRDQRDAARDWIAFLLAPDRQRSLISFGLRPVFPELTVGDERTNNPFVTAAQFNVQLDVNRSDHRPPPKLSGKAVDVLTEVWRKATGYY